MTQFNVGDRIEIIVPDPFCQVGLEQGDQGTIIAIDDDGDFIIEMDKAYNDGHDCNGRTKVAQGLYFDPSNDDECKAIKVINNKETTMTTEFNINDRVQVKSLWNCDRQAEIGKHDFLIGGIATIKAKILSGVEYFVLQFEFSHPLLHNCGMGGINVPEYTGQYIRCSNAHKHLTNLSYPQQSTKKTGALVLKKGQKIHDYVQELIDTGNCNATRLKWLKTFQRCILPPKIRNQIEEALTVVLNKDKFEQWGINEHFEKGLTNGILLWGLPGVGKSMIAESIAAVLDKNLMKLDSGDIQSNVPGKTERNIKQAFEDAKAKQCVLMFDECDSMLSNRDLVGVIMGAEINVLLTEIENFDGVVVLTSNRLHRLDPALARRIVSKIELPMPNFEAREQIWQSLIPPQMPISKDMDFKILAEYEISGGEIKNAILLAARTAIANQKEEVTLEDFVESAQSVMHSSLQFANAQPKQFSALHYANEHHVKPNGHMTREMDMALQKEMYGAAHG